MEIKIHQVAGSGYWTHLVLSCVSHSGRGGEAKGKLLFYILSHIKGTDTVIHTYTHNVLGGIEKQQTVV